MLRVVTIDVILSLLSAFLPSGIFIAHYAALPAAQDRTQFIKTRKHALLVHFHKLYEPHQVLGLLLLLR
jgi:hypothetical protein